MNDVWGLFPYPTIHDGKIQSGSLVTSPSICDNCRLRECLTNDQATGSALAQCRLGMTFARLDDRRVVIGVAANDLPTSTKRSKRVVRKFPKNRVKAADVSRAIATARALGPEVVDDFRLSRERILHDLRESPDMHNALATRLRKDFDANLDQSHDFLQLVKLVRGHAEALLLTAHPEHGVVGAAELEPSLGAIYFSTELMLIKMDSLVFLREVNRALGGSSVFEIHPYILKYVRIYNWQSKQKNVKLNIRGSSYGRVLLNSDAVGAVIQGLLDNLVKYSPAGSEASIEFNESEHEISVQFSGLGPRIEPEEIEKIFLPGFRASAARKIEESGLGIGLATAREISDVLDLRLSVEQAPEEDGKYRDRYRTTFELIFQKVI